MSYKNPYTGSEHTSVELEERSPKTRFIAARERIILGFFGLIILACWLGGPLLVLPDTGWSQLNPWMVFGIAGGATVLIGFAGWMIYRSALETQVRYFCDDDSIWRIMPGDDDSQIYWRNVEDVKLNMTVNGLIIDLLDQNTERVLRIKTEVLSRGGRLLLDVVQEQLQEIFKRHAQDYLSGEKHWSCGFTKDAVKLENDTILLNIRNTRYPVETSIPLTGLKKIEWLPGKMSGLRGGCIEIHAMNQPLIRIPESVKGIQYLLFVLKYIHKLEGVVNPGLRTEEGAEIDYIRVRQTKKSLQGFVGIAFAIIGVMTTFIVVSHYISQQRLQSLTALPLTLGVLAASVWMLLNYWLAKRRANARIKELEERLGIIPPVQVVAVRKEIKKFDAILMFIACVWLLSIIFFSERILGVTMGIKWLIAISPSVAILIYLQSKKNSSAN